MLIILIGGYEFYTLVEHDIQETYVGYSMSGSELSYNGLRIMIWGTVFLGIGVVGLIGRIIYYVYRMVQRKRRIHEA